MKMQTIPLGHPSSLWVHVLFVGEHFELFVVCDALCKVWYHKKVHRLCYKREK